MNHSETLFEQHGGTYTKVGDYRLPNLIVGESEQQPIGKYGRMRKRYLREHRPVLYTNLLTTGKLGKHLAEIDRTHRSTSGIIKMFDKGFLFYGQRVILH